MRWALNIKDIFKYLCIALVFISSIIFNGCSQSTVSNVSTGFYDLWIDYVTFEYANGVVVQKYTVDVNEERLYQEEGMTASQIACLEVQIKNTFEDFYYTNTFLPRYTEIEEQIFARTDMTVDEKYEYLAGFTCDVNLASGGEIVAQRTFLNLEQYQDFYDNSGYTVTADTELDQNLFFNRYVTGRKNIYYYNVVHFSNFWGVDKTKVYLTETYASPDTSLKSNANLIETTQGVKMHQWEISLLDQEIEFYTYIPVTKDWYVLSLTLTAFFTIMIAIFSISRIDDTKPPIIKLKKKEKFVNLKDIVDE